MALLESLRLWLKRGWRRISGVALHPPEPADSVSLPRRPVATGPLPPEPKVSPDALSASLKTPGKTGQRSPAMPLPTIQPPPQPDTLPCVATIQPDLGTVNIRSGPGLTYPRIERAAGGMQLGAAGVSGPDKKGFPWYWVIWAGGSGWVRSDFVTLAGDDTALLAEAPSAVEPPYSIGPAEPGERWKSPVSGRMVQGYHNTHRAYDLEAVPDTRIKAGGPGTVIRRMVCATCQGEPWHIPPDQLTAPQFEAAFADPEWGFGDGSYLIVRHDYADLPEALRAEMDAQDLSGGYAYVQYAHLDRMDAELDESVTAETVLGTTGLTGCSAGPTLHLAVKIGREEKIEGYWGDLPAVHPGLLFFFGEAEG